MNTLIITFLVILSGASLFTIGMLLLIKSKDNITKKLFSYFLVLLSLSVVFLSVNNLYEYFQTGAIVFTLIDGRIITFFLGGISFFILLPTLSLLSELSQWKKIVTSILPLFICIIFFIILSSLPNTVLTDQGDIGANISLIKKSTIYPDVLFRIILLALSFLTPLIIILLTFYINLFHKKRHLTYFYSYAYVITIIISILFIGCMLHIIWMVYSFLIVCSSYLIVISILFLKNDSLITKAALPPTTSTQPFPMEMEENLPYRSNADIWSNFESIINKDERFCIETSSQQIASEMKINVVLLNSLLHFKGYNSFNEYINMLRLEKFKTLAKSNPRDKIINLYESAGFTSKTSFYRFFSSVEGITPAQFLSELTKQSI